MASLWVCALLMVFYADHVASHPQDLMECGVSHYENEHLRTKRVVNGTNAGYGTFPWMAYLRRKGRVKPFCGGSLVSHLHVVTAAHCVKDETCENIQVVLGDYVVAQFTEQLPEEVFNVSGILIHKGYVNAKYDIPSAYDVAVIRLSRSSKPIHQIIPICLPDFYGSFLNQTVTIAGWGARSYMGMGVDVLQVANVVVVKNEVCERWIHSRGHHGYVLAEDMLCAGYEEGGVDTCQGDSGGPLMLYRDEKWYLIGVTSWGKSCAERRQPGFYHRVTYTIEWLKRAIRTL